MGDGLQHALIVLVLVVAEALRLWIDRKGPSRRVRRRKQKQAPLVHPVDQQGL